MLVSVWSQFPVLVRSVQPRLLLLSEMAQRSVKVESSRRGSDLCRSSIRPEVKPNSSGSADAETNICGACSFTVLGRCESCEARPTAIWRLDHRTGGASA